MTKNVLVTGAAGFVGRHLVPMLLKKNFNVTSLIKTTKDKKYVAKESTVIVGDLAKEGSWEQSLKGNDIVIHLAAEISSKSFQNFKKNNVLATKNLMKASKKYKVKKIILFSSAAVTSIRQDDYAKTKAQQEEIVTKSGINYIVLRPSMIYGPGDTKNVGWLIKIIQKYPLIPLPGGGNFGRQPVFVSDICRIVLKLTSKKYKNIIFEIHGFEYITMNRMVKTIIKELHTPRIMFNIPIMFLVATFAIGEKIIPSPKFTLDQIKSLISGEKFKGHKWWNLFDIIPTKFEDGVREMIKSEFTRMLSPNVSKNKRKVRQNNLD